MAAEHKEPPRNIDAEQAVLGALLTCNGLIQNISCGLDGSHFYEPIHGKIFSVISQYVREGILATPVSMKHVFQNENAFLHLGENYLAQLAGIFSPLVNVDHLAKIIKDLSHRRSLIEIGKSIVNSAYDASVFEVSALTQAIDAGALLSSIITDERASKQERSMSSISIDVLNKISDAKKRNKSITGISTGFLELDRYLAGMQNSDLIILAGRPSMGKTALAVNIAVNSCKYLALSSDTKECGVAFFSLEMSADQLVSRMLSMESGVGFSRMRVGDVSPEQFQDLVRAHKTISELKFFIEDTPAITIDEFKSKARIMKNKNNISIIFIDYLQLLRGSSSKNIANRVHEVSEITQGLKAVAKELDIPVVALSQLSRAVEQRDDKRPQLSDLRDSGSIEQDADVVMFVYREQYYLERAKPACGSKDYSAWAEKMSDCVDLADVIISKQRNGDIGTVSLTFDQSTTLFV